MTLAIENRELGNAVVHVFGASLAPELRELKDIDQNFHFREHGV